METSQSAMKRKNEAASRPNIVSNSSLNGVIDLCDLSDETETAVTTTTSMPSSSKYSKRVTPSPTFMQSSSQQASSTLQTSHDLSSNQDSSVSPVVKTMETPVADGTKKTKAPVNNDTNVRRSGRARTSTSIEIDGYTVLKQNNYVLKGLTYIYGDNTTTTKTTTTKKRKATTEKHPNAKKASRVVAPVEVARQEHNAIIRQRVATKANLRTQHLKQQLSVLKPFLQDPNKLALFKVDKDDTAKDDVTNSREIFLQPEAIQADLRDYQLAGLNWMVKMHEKNLGMILGDEMGLGKTLQTISLLCYLKEKEGITGPSLVICPLSVLYSWCNELEKWAPTLKVLRFHSSCSEERDSQRNIFLQDAPSYDVVITTYEMAKQPQLRNLWNRQYFNYLVLDEGHKIKDSASLISQAVRSIHRENSLILTGTPLQNNLVELWSLLNFLYPDVFISSEPFAQAFDISTNVVNKEVLQSAQKLLSLFMLRRLKDQVEKLMPKKIETKVLCPLSSTQVFWYKALLMKDISLLAKTMDEDNVTGTTKGKTKGQTLSNLIMQLRKCCLHPFLFSGAEANPDETSLEDLIASSGKLAVLDKLLRSLYLKGHRTVLFSQFTSILDILEDYCILRGWSYCRFDGSTARASRNYIVNSFNEEGSDKFIFLMSTRSGGMGLNLQTADTCILYDSDWNPQPDLQAMARVHRIGQKKVVHVYRLITNGTIEERMVERAEKKLFMDRMVNTEGGSGTTEDTITERDVVSTLRFGCNAVFGQDAKNDLPSDEDIEIITDRSRSEDFSGGNLKGGTASKTNDFDADKELTASTKLAGIDFKAIRDEHMKQKNKQFRDLGSIKDVWRQIQDKKRKSKRRLVMVDGMKSGYGKASVPVLVSNNYELQNGESSVFSRELQSNNRDAFGVQKRRVKRSGVDFESQDFCQVCGDGGELIQCPRCPIAIHLHSRCSGVSNAKDFMCCSHHRCCMCNKCTVAAGGLLFPCESCPNAYCEDCRPAKSTMLGQCERFKELGYEAKNTVYIHCSNMCTNVAKSEFGWKEPRRENRKSCPPPIDVSDQFGVNVDEALDTKPEDIPSRLRTRGNTAAAVSTTLVPPSPRSSIKTTMDASSSPVQMAVDKTTSRVPVMTTSRVPIIVKPAAVVQHSSSNFKVPAFARKKIGTNQETAIDLTD